MPSEELDVPTNFRTQQWEQARETLDAVFHRIFDLLKNNPSLHALVDGRESEPQHKPGDFAVDYRDGNIRLKMSDGKNLLEISLSALAGTINATQHGQQGFEVTAGAGDLMHPLVTGANAGFMSIADKNKLNGLTDVNPSASVPVSNPIGGAGAIGSSLLYARADHVHPIAAPGTPAPLGTANDGASAIPARADHVHAHGNLGGGLLHALASGSNNGFCTGAERTAINMFDGHVTGATAPAPALGHYAFYSDAGSNTYLYFTGSHGTRKVLLTAA